MLAVSYTEKEEPNGETRGKIKLLEIPSGMVLQTLTGHAKQVTSLCFSPDGKTLASGSWDYTVRVWNVSTGQELWSSEEPPVRHYSVPFSPNGKVVATARWGGGGKLWDASNGAERLRLAGVESVHGLTFRHDGRVLAGGDSKGALLFWDPVTGTRRGKIQLSAGPILGVAYSPEGGYLAAANSDGSVYILRLPPPK
jgi:WD40 repeat protein